MALIAIIIFFFFLVVGRFFLYYQQNKKIVFETSKFSPLSIVILLLIVCGFGGILYSAILEFKGIFNPEFDINLELTTIAWIVFFTGLVLSLISQHQMGESWRMAGINSDDTKLITSGIFKYSRNPIYLGILISFLGLIILLPDTLTVMCYFIFYIAFYLLVRYIEEPHLYKVHKIKYQDYCIKVGRFFPRLF